MVVNMLTMVCVQFETGIPNRAGCRGSVASFPGHTGRRNTWPGNEAWVSVDQHPGGDSKEF